MSNPVAAYTFDYCRIYLSERTGGAPGAGTWGDPVTIFDGATGKANPSLFFKLLSFSAGSLIPGSDYGIVGGSDVPYNGDLYWVGNGLPALPSKIVFTEQASAGYTPVLTFWDADFGGFKKGSAFYIPVKVWISRHWVTGVIKSTDSGSTWTLIDQTHAPASPSLAVAIQRFDDVLYFFESTTGTIGFGHPMALCSFDLATDTWGAQFAAGSDFHYNPYGFANYATQLNSVFKFPNGDFAVLYSNTTSVVYRLWDSAASAWGSEIAVTSGWLANCLIDPSFAKIHVFAYAPPDYSPNSPVSYSTVQHDGTVTAAIATIPAPVYHPAFGFGSDGVGHCAIQNGLLFVPRDDYNDNDNTIWVSTLPVVSFEPELLPIPPGETNLIDTYAIADGGLGYTASDTGTIDGGVFPAYYRVVSVLNGVVSGASLTSPGYTYTYAVGSYSLVPGGAQPGSGTGATLNVTAVDGIGQISGYTLASGGSGFAVGDTGTVDTTGTTTYVVTAVVAGVISGLTITNLGPQYSAATYYLIPGGAQPGVGLHATIDVTSVGAAGQITAFHLSAGGHGYAVGDTGTVDLDGTATYVINSVIDGQVETIQFINPGGGYTAVSGVTTTTGSPQPGTGSGLTINILTLKGKFPSCAYMIYDYAYSPPPPIPPSPGTFFPQYIKRRNLLGH